MKYKIEIIADSMDELLTKVRITFVDLSRDNEFLRKIESKGMESIFFTKYANIKTLKENSNELY